MGWATSWAIFSQTHLVTLNVALDPNKLNKLSSHNEFFQD
jgi:hypothetical protein